MKQHESGFVKICEAAKSKIKETDVPAVKAKLEAQECFYLVDVREESEWANGHLPTAIHLSKGVIERDIEKRIPDRNAAIVLYCGGGYRSALAAENIQRMGYTHVLSMDGGFRGWMEAGLPVVKQ